MCLSLSHFGACLLLRMLSQRDESEVLLVFSWRNSRSFTWVMESQQMEVEMEMEMARHKPQSRIVSTLCRSLATRQCNGWREGERCVGSAEFSLIEAIV